MKKYIVIPKSINEIPNITPKVNGMSINPVFTICSSISFLVEDKLIRPIIATIGVPDEIKLKLINESLYFSKLTEFALNYKSFKDFLNYYFLIIQGNRFASIYFNFYMINNN